MQEISVRATAKINLGLDVTGKRADGYHELRMIMQSVQLCDRIRLRRTEERGIRLRTNLECLPTDEHNLAYRAAQLLLETPGIRGGEDSFGDEAACAMKAPGVGTDEVSCAGTSQGAATDGGLAIEIEKAIPVAAGLAGGSSDAAAVLVGVNELFGLGLTQAQLMKLGVKLGADVPYCVLRGTALAEGIGEKLTVLPALPACYILIAKPDAAISTKYVYTHLDLASVTAHPDIDAQVRALEAGDLQGVCRHAGNVLERVTEAVCPEVKAIRTLIAESGALCARMSGSGPSVFGIFEEETAAERCAEALRQRADLRVECALVTQAFRN